MQILSVQKMRVLLMTINRLSSKTFMNQKSTKPMKKDTKKINRINLKKK